MRYRVLGVTLHGLQLAPSCTARNQGPASNWLQHFQVSMTTGLLIDSMAVMVSPTRYAYSRLLAEISFKVSHCEMAKLKWICDLKESDLSGEPTVSDNHNTTSECAFVSGDSDSSNKSEGSRKRIIVQLKNTARQKKYGLHHQMFFRQKKRCDASDASHSNRNGTTG